MTAFHNISCSQKHNMQKKILQTVIFIIFWDFLMFYQIFFSPQVRWCATITYKHGIYELPFEFAFWKLETFSWSALFHWKTRVSLKYFVNNCRFFDFTMNISIYTQNFFFGNFSKLVNFKCTYKICWDILF